jgi:hypothetical protein
LFLFTYSSSSKSLEPFVLVFFSFLRPLLLVISTTQIFSSLQVSALPPFLLKNVFFCWFLQL